LDVVYPHLALLPNTDILEPASGDGALVNRLREHGHQQVEYHDLYRDGVDFLTYQTPHDWIITNPPFSQFDEFVLHAKELAPKVLFIGKLNFLGAYKRGTEGVWDNLSHIWVFNRMVDYRTPTRGDGLFHVGNLVTGWFLWDRDHLDKKWEMSILDVQPYAKLGQYKV
jgi:hypothetical protein